MNTTDRVFDVHLDRRTLLRSLLLATGGIITNSHCAEALTITPRQKDIQFPKDAALRSWTIPSRFSHIEEETGKKLMGVKMICIDDSFSEEQIAQCDVLPVRGHVYTIRKYRIAFRVKKDTYHPAFLFDEIVNTRLLLGKEPGFWATRFEPYDSDDEQGDVELANEPDAR